LCMYVKPINCIPSPSSSPYTSTVSCFYKPTQVTTDSSVLCEWNTGTPKTWVLRQGFTMQLRLALNLLSSPGGFKLNPAVSASWILGL
jgi:hypothetical protein